MKDGAPAVMDVRELRCPLSAGCRDARLSLTAQRQAAGERRARAGPSWIGGRRRPTRSQLSHEVMPLGLRRRVAAFAEHAERGRAERSDACGGPDPRFDGSVASASHLSGGEHQGDGML